MENSPLQKPILIELNEKITIGDKEINITGILNRPVMKRIVVLSKELNRTIIYEDWQYEAHKDDSIDELITEFKTRIS